MVDEIRPQQSQWKTNRAGHAIGSSQAGRWCRSGERSTYVRFLDDFPCFPSTNVWDDTVISGYADAKVYVVQTATKVIERCMLMTTDPGDLVLDPTCGSGTTAVVAEQWGRRWITIDTSRVALALARTRLMALPIPVVPASGRALDVKHGFVCRARAHVTLKSIAQNPDIREGMSRGEIEQAIARHADCEMLYDQP